MDLATKAKTITVHVQYLKDQRNYLVKIAFRFFGSCKIHENLGVPRGAIVDRFHCVIRPPL
jgi:hypothetical protein